MGKVVMRTAFNRRAFVWKAGSALLGVSGVRALLGVVGSSKLHLHEDGENEKSISLSYRAIRRLGTNSYPWNYIPFRSDIHEGAVVNIFCRDDGKLWARAKVCGVDRFKVGEISRSIEKRITRSALNIQDSIRHNFQITDTKAEMLLFKIEDVRLLKSSADLLDLARNLNPRVRIVSSSDLVSLAGLQDATEVRLAEDSILTYNGSREYSPAALRIAASDRMGAVVVRSRGFGLASQRLVDELVEQGFQNVTLVI